MAVHCRLALLCGLGALLLGQASHAAPPFEKLSLRDALLARPEIIASLDQEARQQLVQRFEAARRNPTEPLRMTTAGATIPVEQMRAMDEARYAARADAFIAGKLVNSPAGLEALPYSTEVSDPGEPMPIEWIATGPTAEAEQSALLGNAGTIIRRLMLISESSRLVRVESWPIAVLAIDGTLYVNAAWLVAMSPYVEPKSPDATKPQTKEPKPSLEPGCGGGAVITPSSQATSNDPRVIAGDPQTKDKTQEPRPTEKTIERAPETQRTADSGGQLPEVQKIFGDDVKTDTAPPKEARTSSDERGAGKLRAETLPPDQNYSYAGAVGLVNPADCCRDQNACGGADGSCAANATVCADPNSTCSTANCSTNTCSTGSCDTSSCNTGSGCSSDDSCNKCNNSGGDSGCSSSSGSDSGCSSGSGSSGSSCSSGSGSSGSSCSGSSGGSSSSSCSGSSGGSSSSSCGSSGGGSSSSSCGSSGSSSSCKSSSCGSSGKCAVAAPPPTIRRRAGDIPDVATLGILLLPLWYLVRQGRRRARA